MGGLTCPLCHAEPKQISASDVLGEPIYMCSCEIIYVKNSEGKYVPIHW